MLKSDPKTANLPVILVTAHAMLPVIIGHIVDPAAYEVGSELGIIVESTIGLRR